MENKNEYEEQGAFFWKNNKKFYFSWHLSLIYLIKGYVI